MASLMSFIVECMNMGYVVPVSKCDLDITIPQQGIINSISVLGALLASYLWGFFVDTWGRQKVLQTSLGCSFAACFLSVFSVSTTMLLITRFLVGFTIAGVPSSGLSYLGEFHSEKTRQIYITFGAMGMTLSSVYQPMVALAILPIGEQLSIFGFICSPWRLFLFVSSLSIAISFVITIFLPESPKFLIAQGRQEEAIEVLKRVYAVNTGKSKDEYPVNQIILEEIGLNLAGIKGPRDAVKAMWEQTFPLFFVPYVGNLTMMCYTMFTFFFVGEAFYLWLPQILSLYAENIDLKVTLCKAIELAGPHHMEESTSHGEFKSKAFCIANSQTYYITGFIGICVCITFIFGGLTINRLGKRNLISGWVGLCTLGSFGLLWGNTFYLNALLMLLLTSIAPCASFVFGAGEDFFPTHHKGMALCLIMFSSQVGTISGSNFLAAIVYTNCTLMIVINSTLLFSTWCLGFYLFRKR